MDIPSEASTFWTLACRCCCKRGSSHGKGFKRMEIVEASDDEEEGQT